jgi:hypothetical protein
MLAHGTAMVRVKAIDPHTYDHQYRFVAQTRPRHFQPLFPRHYSAIKPQHTTPTYIEVGAYAKRINAEKMQRRLKSYVQLPVHIFNPIGREHLYRVQIGPVKDMATVDKISHRLKNLGLTPTRA